MRSHARIRSHARSRSAGVRQETLAAAACSPRQGLHYKNTGVWNGWRTLGCPVSVCETRNKENGSLAPVTVRDGTREPPACVDFDTSSLRAAMASSGTVKASLTAVAAQQGCPATSGVNQGMKYANLRMMQTSSRMISRPVLANHLASDAKQRVVGLVCDCSNHGR